MEQGRLTLGLELTYTTCMINVIDRHVAGNEQLSESLLVPGNRNVGIIFK